jgi:chromosome segregation ATPase
LTMKEESIALLEKQVCDLDVHIRETNVEFTKKESDWKKQLDDLMQETSDLTSERRATSVELAKKAEIIAMLKDELEHTDQKIQDLDDELDQKEADWDDERRTILREKERLKINLGKDLEVASKKLAEKEDIIASLEEELAQMQTKESLASSTESRSVQGRIEVLEDEIQSLREKNAILEDELHGLERSALEQAEREKVLEEEVEEWMTKACDYKLQVKTVAKELETRAAEGDVAAQSFLLQDAMEKKKASAIAQSKNTGPRWPIGKIFIRPTRSSDDEEEVPPGDRLAALEASNSKLEASNAELKSDFVKMQSSYKDEVYELQKKLEAIKAENEAYALTNLSLQQRCELLTRGEDEES